MNNTKIKTECNVRQIVNSTSKLALKILIFVFFILMLKLCSCMLSMTFSKIYIYIKHLHFKDLLIYYHANRNILQNIHVLQ